MGFWDGYAPGTKGGGVTFTTKQGSGKKATLSNQPTSGFWGGYTQASKEDISKMDAMDKINSLDKLNQKDAYNAIQNAKKLGIINRDKTLEYIKAIGQREQTKIKDEFQKSLNPIESFVGGTISTGQKTLNSLQLLGTTLAGEAAVGSQKTKVGKEAAVQETKRLADEIANRKTLTGDFGTVYQGDSSTIDKATLLDALKGGASYAGEVLPYILPYGQLSKVAGTATAPLVSKIVGTTAKPIIEKVVGAGLKFGANTAINAPGFVVSNALTQYGKTGQVDVAQALESGLVGGAMTAGGELIGDLLRKGPTPQLQALKAERAATASKLGSSLDIGAPDELLPKKVNVTGGGKAEKVGVKTPIAMTDKEYTTQFNKLSNDYNKSVKQIEQMAQTQPKTQIAIAQNILDESFQAKLQQLDDAFKTPGMQPIKRTAKVSTTKTTGSKTETAVVGATTPQVEGIAPSTGKVAPNATYARLAADTEVPVSTRQALTNITHEVHNDKALVKNAQTIVKDNVDNARQLFDSNDLAAYNPDSQIHLGNALVDKYNALGLTDDAAKVYDSMIGTTSVSARGTRAAQSISKVSPQGIVSYAQKVADKSGRELHPELVKQLQVAANDIVKMADGPEKEAAIRVMLDIAENKGTWQKMEALVKGGLSLPRSLMTSFDLSFGLRQGAVLGAGYPKAWAKAQADGVRFATSPTYYEKAMKGILDSTDSSGANLYPLYKKMGLSLEGVTGGSEEVFGKMDLIRLAQTSKVSKGLVAPKIVAEGVAASDRAFTGSAAILRSDVAKEIIEGYGGVAKVNQWSKKALEDMGKAINTASGRGGGKAGGWFEKSAPAMSETLFSARLWKSRLDLINPVYYAKLSPAARKVALRSSGSFGTMVGVVLMAAGAVGADVEYDPRSSDFMKIKIGNTRYDIMGGLQQNIVLAARQITGETKKADGTIVKMGPGLRFGEDGKPVQIGGGVDTPGPYTPNRLSVLANTITNKAAPVVGTGMKFLSGDDSAGNPIDPWQEIASLFIPLNIQDTADATNDSGGNVLQGILKASPGTFGVGVNTYAPSSKGESFGTATGKAISALRDQIGADELKKAGKEYDTKYNKWFSGLSGDKTYKSLSDTDKAKVIRDKKAALQQELFDKYNFEYVAPEPNEEVTKKIESLIK